MSRHSRALPQLWLRLCHTQIRVPPSAWLCCSHPTPSPHPHPSCGWVKVQPSALPFLDHASSLRTLHLTLDPSSSFIVFLLFNMTSSRIEETCSQASHKCHQCHVTGTPCVTTGQPLRHGLVYEAIYILAAVRAVSKKSYGAWAELDPVLT